MHDTKIRVIAAIFHFEEFTVRDLCARALLSRSQVYPVFSNLLNREKVIRKKKSNASGARHRPPWVYEVIPDKKQELVNQLYGLTRVLEGRSEKGDRHWESIDEDLDSIDRFLNMTDRAIAREGLHRAEMEWVEIQMKSMYRRLENATYEAGLDIREPANQTHPLVGLWSRWKDCAQKAHEIVNRWQSSAQTATDKAPAIQVMQVEKLEIVTDPSFIDSAIFMWIFSQQPFRSANMNIDCELVPIVWKKVLDRVGKSDNAIAFYNRSASVEKAGTGPAYWADLCVYSGYALLIHRIFAPDRCPQTLQQAQECIDKFIETCRAYKKPPLITLFGQDTIWRLGTQLTERTKIRDFHFNIIDDPESAFQAFRANEFSLFVGGLPQRLQAEYEGHVPLLDARLKPEWTAVNGLFHSRNLAQSGGPVLEKALTFWYKTIDRLKRDSSFRHNAARMIRAMLQEEFRYPEDFFPEWMLEEVFKKEDDLEFFAAKPADVTYRLLRKVDDAATRDEQRERDEKYKKDPRSGVQELLEPFLTKISGEVLPN